MRTAGLAVGSMYMSVRLFVCPYYYVFKRLRFLKVRTILRPRAQSLLSSSSDFKIQILTTRGCGDLIGQLAQMRTCVSRIVGVFYAATNQFAHYHVVENGITISPADDN